MKFYHPLLRINIAGLTAVVFVVFCLVSSAAADEKRIRGRLENLDTALSLLSKKLSSTTISPDYPEQCQITMKEYPEISGLSYLIPGKKIVNIVGHEEKGFKTTYSTKSIKNLRWFQTVVSTRKTYYGKLHEKKRYYLFWVKPYLKNLRRKERVRNLLIAKIDLTKSIAITMEQTGPADFLVAYRGDTLHAPSSGGCDDQNPALIALYGYKNIQVVRCDEGVENTVAAVETPAQTVSAPAPPVTAMAQPTAEEISTPTPISETVEVTEPLAPAPTPAAPTFTVTTPQQLPTGRIELSNRGLTAALIAVSLMLLGFFPFFLLVLKKKIAALEPIEQELYVQSLYFTTPEK